MDTYYEEILKEIRKLMAEGDFKEAFAILEDELAIAYIPRDSEAQMIELYNECRSELQVNKTKRAYDDDDIVALLNGSLEQQFMAVEMLKKSNLRNHMEEIEAYLCNQPEVLVRCLLIDALMEQNISEEFHTVEDGMEITFLPCYIEPPMRAAGAVIAANTLCEWFEDEDPTFLKMCMECLIQEAYLHLPFNIDEDEGLPLAIAIVGYVRKAQDNEAEFETFIAEKNLAQGKGFALLLNKHGI